MRASLLDMFLTRQRTHENIVGYYFFPPVGFIQGQVFQAGWHPRSLNIFFNIDAGHLCRDHDVYHAHARIISVEK